MLNTKTSKRAHPRNSNGLVTGMIPVTTSRSSRKLLVAKVSPRSARALELALQSAERLLEQSATSGEALTGLANLLAANLPIAYCRLLLSPDGGESLIPCAAQTALANLKWEPQLHQPLPLALLPDGLRLSGLTYSLMGQWREMERLIEYSALLKLNTPLTGLLLIPLKVGDRLLGVIELGELPDATLNEQEVQSLILHCPGLASPLNECLRRF